MNSSKIASYFVVFLTLIGFHRAEAFITQLPLSLAQEVLSETVPTAFAPFDLKVEDYQLEWVGQPLSQVDLSWMPGSLQWVRVASVFSLPRARLRLAVKSSQAVTGLVSNAGFHQALSRTRGGPADIFEVQLPVALLSGAENSIEVTLRAGKETRKGTVRLRFKARPELGENRIFTDPSCSRFGVTATGSAQSSKNPGWAYMGCRLTELEGLPQLASSLEIFTFWDNVGQSLQVGGVSTPSTSVSVWPLRLRSDPGTISLATESGVRADVSYRMAPVYRRGSLGLGVGPYTNDFQGSESVMGQWAPSLTLYGSYFITEQIRLVSFGAATIYRPVTTDLGVYLHTEYLKLLDDRLVVSVLLGVHANGFRDGNTYRLIMGAPQGFELKLVDTFSKAKNFVAGAFIYPEIQEKSYYNVWLRWGAGAYFGEVNYISWSEKIDANSYRSRSLGVCLGFPVARFL